MVKIIQQNSNSVSPRAKKELYQCEECDLKYNEKEIAEKCEEWCRKNKSCNLDIIKHAIKENGESSSK